MLRSRTVILCGVVLFGATLSAAQTQKRVTPASPDSSLASSAAKLQGLDDLADRAMKDWKVPGLAIAVVQDGKVIYVKGYGYRDLENKLPVTTGTVFPIGSITKSFTALTFAILKDEGKADWDRPVRDYVPEFQMKDPVASEQATPRDLFSHRTGLPRHDLAWYSGDFSREDLLSHLRYLKPNKSFRSTYQYNNLTVMTMGYLEGKITGLGWEGSIRQKVFAPLGMAHSSLSVGEIEKSEDHALPYELKKDVATRVPFHNIDAIGPAGSINSSVDDMAHYLTLQLGDGKYGDTQIVSESNLREMHSPQTAIPDRPARFDLPGLGHFSYGLGWVVTSYRGHNLVWHNGGIDGFYALLSMLPDDHLGVVVLTNMPNGETPEVLAYNIYDRLLGLDPWPWFDRYKDLQAKGKHQEEEEKKNKTTDRKAGTHPSHDLAEYAGEYQNPGYGTVRVAVKGHSLELSINKLGPYPLAHYHYDVFQVPETSDGFAAGEKFQFEMNKKGDIDRFFAEFEPALGEDIVFLRAPERISQALVQGLTGDHRLGETTAPVLLPPDVFTLAVPGQPQDERASAKGLSIDVDAVARTE